MESPATTAPRAGWGWPGLCFALMAPVFAFALSRNLSASHPGVQLAPFAERQVIAAALALPIFPALFVVALVVARRWRWAIGGTLLGLLPVGALGSLALITVSSPHFIFAPVFVRSEKSADGARIAHLYRDDFLACRWKVTVGAPTDAVVPEALSQSHTCSDPAVPRVRWLEDAGVALELDDGGVPPDTDAPFHF